MTKRHKIGEEERNPMQNMSDSNGSTDNIFHRFFKPAVSCKHKPEQCEIHPSEAFEASASGVCTHAWEYRW